MTSDEMKEYTHLKELNNSMDGMKQELKRLHAQFNAATKIDRNIRQSLFAEITSYLRSHGVETTINANKLYLICQTRYKNVMVVKHVTDKLQTILQILGEA